MTGKDILADLRAWRDEFARRHDYDLAAMTAVLRELDRAAGARAVRGEPRRPAGGLPQGTNPQKQELQPAATP